MSSLPPELWHLVAIELDILSLDEVLELACVNRFVSEALLGSKWATDHLKAKRTILKNICEQDWDAARLSLDRVDEALEMMWYSVFTTAYRLKPHCDAQVRLIVKLVEHIASSDDDFARQRCIELIDYGDRPVIEAILGLQVQVSPRMYQTVIRLAASIGAVDVCRTSLDHDRCMLGSIIAGMCATGDMEIYDAFKDDEGFVCQSCSGSVLGLAAKAGQVELVRRILDDFPETINTTTKDSESPLIEATRINHLEIVQLLLAQPDIDTTHHALLYGTARQIAFNRGYVEVLQAIARHEDGDGGGIMRSDGPSCYRP